MAVTHRALQAMIEISGFAVLTGKQSDYVQGFVVAFSDGVAY